METIEMPIAQGVATPVIFNTAPTMTKHEMEVEFHQSGEAFSSLNGNVFSSDRELDASIMSADLILESAKDNGFELTLMDIADGKFDDPEQEEVEQELGQKEAAIEEKEEVVEEEINPYESMHAINNDLLAQFKAELREVQGRVASIEGNYVSSDAFLEAMLLLAEIKKAKSEKEKIGLFQLLVMAMTRILVEIAPKEEGDYAESPQKGAKNGQEKPINIEDMRKSLVKNGMMKSRPAVEKQVA